MSKSLLLTALLAGGVLTASAQVTDVTNQYIANPSFELGTDGTPASSGKGSFVPYNWATGEVPNQYFNSGIYAANETSSTSASAFGTTVAPADGDYYYFVRKSWGSGHTYLTQTLGNLPEGKYLLSANYKAATNTDPSRPYIDLSVKNLTDETVVTAESDKGTKQGNTYFNTASWKKISIPFEVTSATDVALTVNFYFGTDGASQVQDAILLDNLNLLTGDVDDIPALDEAFKTIEGLITTAQALAKDNGQDITAELAEAETVLEKKYANSLDEVNTFISNFKSKLDDIYESDADVTALVVKNASFETGDGTGWTWANANDTGVKPNSSATYATEGVDGSYLFNTWGGSSEKYIKQTVEITHDGFYTLQALGAGDDGSSVTIYAGSAKADIQFIGKGQFVQGQTPKIFCKAGSTLEIGATSTSWYKVDNFHLIYGVASLDEAVKAYQHALAEATAVASEQQPMNGTVRSDLDNARNAGVNQEDFDALTKLTAVLENATAAAKASIAAYANAAEGISGIQTLLKYNTVAEANAKEEYQSYLNKLSADYNASTLTDEEAEAVVNPYAITGWRANSLRASEYLISAWDAEAYDWNNYHVNTWSTEGTNDGSGFVVPFIEYWTGDANELGAKAMTATVVVEDPDYENEVNAWVRVRLTNGRDDVDYTKIKFVVGEPTTTADGEVVYDNTVSLQELIEEGVQVETPASDSPFRLMHISKRGAADAEGNLKIQYVVEEGSNVSWMCWKDMTVICTDVPTGLNKVEKANTNATDNAVYNIAGQKVNGLQKGLNIVGGKKVLVK